MILSNECWTTLSDGKLARSAGGGCIEFMLPDFSDERGSFMELFKVSTLQEVGIDVQFLQANISHSDGGVIRGLHYQEGMGKLVMPITGMIQDVALERKEDGFRVSRTLVSGMALWVPPNWAHGFSVRSDKATVCYMCSAEWNKDLEGGYNPISSDDAKWFELPTPNGIILSDKDKAAPLWPFG